MFNLFGANSRKTYFTPYDDAETALTQLLSSAQSKIRMAVFALTLKSVTQTLIQKHQQGIDVAVILDSYEATTDKPEAARIAELKSAGVPLTIGTSSKKQIMHSKFVVVDDKTVGSGSYNFTSLAQLEDNVFEVETNKKRAQAFNTAWQQIHDWIEQNNAPIS